jgi:hypothetical protein
LKEEEREFIKDANLEISRQRAATEEAGRLLMEAERQKLYEINAHRHYEAFAREQARRTEIEASRQRLEARGQCRRQAPATPAAMLHRQMCEARDEKRARMDTNPVTCPWHVVDEQCRAMHSGPFDQK